MFVDSTMDFKSHRVTYTGTNGDYINGQEYEILIQRMSDSRYAVFKSSTHYREVPGYKVFNSIEDIKTQFSGL